MLKETSPARFDGGVMRLNGYVPIWGEDVQKFFMGAPREYVLFYWLLSNRHYGDEPFRTWITGKKYKQEWIIYPGDVVTSKLSIEQMWGFHRTRSQKILLTNLAEKNLIEILLQDPCLIVRIKNYKYFAWAGRNEDRPPFIHSSPIEGNGGVIQTDQGVINSDQGMVQMDQGTMVNSDQGMIQTDQGVIQNADLLDLLNARDDKNGSQLRLRSKIKIKEREGDARARGESPPPFLNSNLEKEDGKEKPPEEAVLLAKDWFIRCKKVYREPNFDESAVLDGIMKLHIQYSFAELRQILDYLNSSPSKSTPAKELITPWDSKKPFFKTDLSLIQQAFIESTESVEGKDLLKKKKDAEPKVPSKTVQLALNKAEEEFKAQVQALKEKGQLYDFSKRVKT